MKILPFCGQQKCLGLDFSKALGTSLTLLPFKSMGVLSLISKEAELGPLSIFKNPTLNISRAGLSVRQVKLHI